jgi:cell division protein ZapA
MEERLISFTLHGQEFSFYSDAPEAEVQEAIALLRSELGQNGPDMKGAAMPSSRLLVLACLRLAGRCVNIEHEFSSFVEERKNHAARNRVISGLIDRVAAALKE